MVRKVWVANAFHARVITVTAVSYVAVNFVDIQHSFHDDATSDLGSIAERQLVLRDSEKPPLTHQTPPALPASP